MKTRKLGGLEVSEIGFDTAEIEAAAATIPVQGARLPEAILQLSYR
jgi:hypothetical protein